MDNSPATQSCYIVTWEVASDSVRKAIIAELKTYPKYCPIHRHCWAVVAAVGAKGIRDQLTPLIESTDRVFVVRSGTVAAWRNSYGEKNSAWLKKNL